MSVTRLAVTTTLLIGSMAVVAQGPVKDTLMVTFPNQVIVAGKPLPPGEYTVRQLESTASPRILEFASEDGTQVQATASTIPMEENVPRDATGVILEQRGNNYYVSKIWVAGQRYGYQFEPPPDGQEEVMRVVRVEGMRMAVAYKPGEAPKEVAQAQQPEPRPDPTPQPTTPPVREPEPTPQPVTPPVKEPEPTPQPTTPPVQEPEPAPTPVRDPMPEQPERTTPAMPDTAAHWMPLLLAGAGMALTGWRLRRTNQ
jgi:hypothetical protein